jgi:hypothetical protein
MKGNIEVKDRRELDAIKSALHDPITRAFVVCVGILLPLSDRQRKRVMFYVSDVLDEEAENAEAELEVTIDSGLEATMVRP